MSIKQALSSVLQHQNISMINLTKNREREKYLIETGLLIRDIRVKRDIERLKIILLEKNNHIKKKTKLKPHHHQNRLR